MSKIEDALRKARSMGVLRGQAASAVTALQPWSTADEPTPVRIDDIEDVILSANKQLARMGDAWFLSEIERADNRIISSAMKNQRIANAFRDLRTRILERSNNRNCIVLVCSATRNNCADFIALNLAVAFSLDESRTALLVDCDVANPKYGRLLRGAREPYGITDFFERDDITIEQIIHPVGIRKLRLMPVGTVQKRDIEYFTSQKVRILLRSARQRYPDRYVIINAAPITDSADTRILAGLADLVVLVVPYGSTTEQQIINAASAVKAEKLLGVVFADEPQLPTLTWKEVIKNTLSEGLMRFLRPLVPRKKSDAPNR